MIASGESLFAGIAVHDEACSFSGSLHLPRLWRQDGVAAGWIVVRACRGFKIEPVLAAFDTHGLAGLLADLDRCVIGQAKLSMDRARGGCRSPNFWLPVQHWPIFGTHTPAQPPPNGRHAPTQHRPAPQQSEGAMPEVSSRALLICRATGLAWIGNFMSVSSGPARDARFCFETLTEEGSGYRSRSDTFKLETIHAVACSDACEAGDAGCRSRGTCGDACGHGGSAPDGLKDIAPRQSNCTVEWISTSATETVRAWLGSLMVVSPSRFQASCKMLCAAVPLFI